MNPNSAQAWHNLGFLLANRFERDEEAEQALQKALELAPDHFQSLSILGFILTNYPSRYDEAEKYLKKSIELFPDDSASWNGLGILYELQKKYTEALNAYMQNLKLNRLMHKDWYSHVEDLQTLIISKKSSTCSADPRQRKTHETSGPPGCRIH